jgi:hypothetical protein
MKSANVFLMKDPNQDFYRVKIGWSSSFALPVTLLSPLLLSLPLSQEILALPKFLIPAQHLPNHLSAHHTISLLSSVLTSLIETSQMCGHLGSSYMRSSALFIALSPLSLPVSLCPSLSFSLPSVLYALSSIRSEKSMRFDYENCSSSDGAHCLSCPKPFRRIHHLDPPKGSQRPSQSSRDFE